MLKNTSAVLVRLVLSFGVAAVPALCVSETGTGTDSPAPPDQQTAPKSDWEKDPSDWKIAIYPIYLWAPVLGAHVDLENFPPRPSNPIAPSGNASSSFNGIGMAGFEIQKSGWSTEGQFLYASISADNTDPKVHLGMDIKYAQLMAGHTIVKGLSLEGGVRRMAFKVSAGVGDYPEVSRNPGIWDPLIGLTWRYQASKKWALRAHLDGGGFGVGSDVSLGAAARADWRFAKHFGVAFGLAALHFQISDSVLDNTAYRKTLTVRQTLWGPLLGFGIYF